MKPKAMDGLVGWFQTGSTSPPTKQSYMISPYAIPILFLYGVSHKDPSRERDMARGASKVVLWIGILDTLLFAAKEKRWRPLYTWSVLFHLLFYLPYLDQKEESIHKESNRIDRDEEKGMWYLLLACFFYFVIREDRIETWPYASSPLEMGLYFLLLLYFNRRLQERA